MKTSELITFLTKSLKENGDLTVVTVDFEAGGFFPIDEPQLVDDKFMEDNQMDSGITGRNLYIGSKIEP